MTIKYTVSCSHGATLGIVGPKLADKSCVGAQRSWIIFLWKFRDGQLKGIGEIQFAQFYKKCF